MFKYLRITVLSFVFLLFFHHVNAGNLYAGVSIGDLNYDRESAIRAIYNPGEVPAGQTQVRYQCNPNIVGACPRSAQIFDVDESISSFNVKLGYQFNNLFALEIRGGFGAGNATVDNYSESQESQTGGGGGQQTGIIIYTSPRDVNMTFNYNIGIYGRLGGAKDSHLSYDFSSNGFGVSPYLLVGYEHYKFDAEALGGSLLHHVKAASYGLGINLYISDDSPLLFNIEWRETDEDDFELPSDLNLTNINFGFEFLF